MSHEYRIEITQLYILYLACFLLYHVRGGVAHGSADRDV